MTQIALKNTYSTDIIAVPDDVAIKIKKHQKSFDKWLYDKDNDHGLWVIIDGKKKAVSFDSSDFVNYLNTYIISNSYTKAKIVQSGLDKTPENMLVIFF